MSLIFTFLEVLSSRHVPYHLLSRRTSWVERTFVASEDAEIALCADRPTFIMRHEILKRIPGNIKKRITHPGDIAQIEGFQRVLHSSERESGPNSITWADQLCALCGLLALTD